MMMRVHVSLQVKSLDASRTFYRALLGQEASKVRADYLNFRMDEPPIHLALQEGDVECCSGTGHFGIELPSQGNLAAWRQRLEAAGLDFVVEDQAACCYARADKLWLQDPDGYRWEVWVRTGEHDALGGACAMQSDGTGKTAACC
jgi:catechol 2,3-dioxygenase-like lactoylglutathione lyase family enzyme